MFGDEGGQIKHIDPNIWAIIAFGSALLGLVAFIRRFKDEDRIGTYAGIAGFISLIILQITIQRMVNNQTEQVVEAAFRPRREIFEIQGSYPRKDHLQT